MNFSASSTSLRNCSSVPVSLLNRVPFVDDDDNRLPLVADEPGDFGVLLGHAVLRVDEQQRHIAAADGGNRPQHAVTLQRLVLHGALAAHARGVDDVVLRAVDGEERVDRVARRAGNVGYHRAFAADQPIHQRRLADVRAADNRQLEDMFLSRPSRPLSAGGEPFADSLQQSPRPSMFAALWAIGSPGPSLEL